jgi:hypothetical protein
VKLAPIAVIVGLALAGVTLLNRDRADSDAATGPLAGPAMPAIGAVAVPPVGRRPAPEPEPLPDLDRDTTGLLDESLTIDELLDRIDADAGDGAEPVDRSKLAAALRSDAEIRKAMGE